MPATDPKTAARTAIADSLTAIARAEPRRADYLTGLATQIRDGKPCLIAIETVLDALTAEERVPLEQRVREVMDEGDGFWRACSGCQESVDGCVSTEDYPCSAVFKCQPGSGCSECGGIGVIWDTTDYEDMAHFMLEQDRLEAAHPVDARAPVDGELRAALERAEKFLDRSVAHVGDCDSYDDGDCTCGLSDAYRAIDNAIATLTETTNTDAGTNAPA